MKKKGQSKRRRLGPLPASPESLNLQRLSLKELNAQLPADKLVLRDERIEDFGVDFSVEVIHERSPTNCRARGQLKARSGTLPAADGSIHLQVETKNFNYLLNGEAPLYILYRPESRELRYCWVRDEARRLFGGDPRWQEKATLTLHLHNILTTDSVEDICERILDESQMDRKAWETVQELAPYGPVRVEFDWARREVTTPVEAAHVLKAAGLVLVSAGQHARIHDLARILTRAAENDPHIQLVLGYACFAEGDYLAADAHLARAEAERNTLDSSDTGFLGVLRDTCEYATGRIDQKEYTVRQERWSKGGEGPTAIHYELLAMRGVLFAARHSSERIQLRQELQALKEKVGKLPEALEGIKLRARLIDLEAEALILGEGFLRLLMTARIGGVLGEHLRGGTNKIAIAATWLSGWADWEVRMRSILDAISATIDPHLLCDALLTRVDAQVTLLTHARLVALGFYGDESGFPALPNSDPGDLDMAEQIAHHHGFRSVQLHVALTRATLLALRDDKYAAKEVAKAALVPIRAQRLVHLERLAQLHCSDAGFVETLAARTRAHVGQDQDRRLSAVGDKELEFEAKDGLLSLHLPDERLAVLLDDYRATRAMARERVEWCRHIVFLQNLGHTFSRETLYAREPERVGYCQELQMKSLIPQADWQSVLVAFKRTYCEGCQHRSPKGEQV